MLFHIHKVVYSTTTRHQNIVNNTQLWLHVLVLPNHPQANIYYMKVHPMYLFPYLLSDLLTSFHTYLLTYWLSYLLTYRITYILTYLFSYLITDWLTYLLSYLITDWLTYLLSYLLSYLITYFLTDLLTSNVSSYNKFWPEDGFVKPKHVDITVYYWLHTSIHVVLRLNQLLYKYGCKWSTGSSGSFIPGKELRYPLNRRVGGLVSKMRKSLPLSGLEPRTQI